MQRVTSSWWEVVAGLRDTEEERWIGWGEQQSLRERVDLEQSLNFPTFSEVLTSSQSQKLAFQVTGRACRKAQRPKCSAVQHGWGTGVWGRVAGDEGCPGGQTPWTLAWEAGFQVAGNEELLKTFKNGSKITLPFLGNSKSHSSFRFQLSQSLPQPPSYVLFLFLQHLLLLQFYTCLCDYSANASLDYKRHENR